VSYTPIAGFGPATTADEVLADVDLRHRTALVTGASGGLGEETARAIAARGATVVMALRDRAKGLAAVARIRTRHPDAKLELAELDLASIASVGRFARAFRGHHRQLDVLIANAGVQHSPMMRTEDGFELHVGVNHLGHFALVNHLTNLLGRDRPSRVVVVSSYAHRMEGELDLNDLNWENTPYNRFRGYARSKTANILFALELDRRLADVGVRTIALHPGMIQTELGRYWISHPPSETEAPIGGLETAMATGVLEYPDRRIAIHKSVQAGAATTVLAAFSPALAGRGGIYLEDCGSVSVTDHGAGYGLRDYAADQVTAASLWDCSCALIENVQP